MSSALPSPFDQDAQRTAGLDRSLRHPVMFFLTCGAAWLAVALLLGVIASAKVHEPGLLDRCGWLTYGRVFPAHMSALVYGWGMQAAFAVILWLSARLCDRPCTAAGTVLTAGVVWNVGVALGMAGILSGNGTGMPWMEFPVFAWPVLLVSYLAIVIWSFIQFRVRSAGVAVISQWYILGAILWFPWVFMTAHLLLHCMPGHPVMATAINAWYQSALVFLFFTPVAIGAAYDLVTRVTGRPVTSQSLATMGFWSLAVIAPWAGMQKLAGAPLPYFLPYFGAAATALLFIPVCAACANILRAAWSVRHTQAADPVLRFTVAGMTSLMVLAVVALVMSLPDSTLRLAQFSLSGHGLDVLALYGFFSMIMFAAAYFIVPRVMGRDWHSPRLVEMHFLFSFYGLITVVLVTLIGGLQQGAGQENWKLAWAGVTIIANPYAVTLTFAWCMILFANAFFCLHLATMWLRWGMSAALGMPANGCHEAGSQDLTESVAACDPHPITAPNS